MRKKVAILLSMVLSSAMLFSACGKGDNAKTSKEDTFKVGLEAGYAPFNWTQKDSSNGAVKIEGSSEYAGGYDIEIAKKNC